jgi:hypothetical protein
LSEAECLKQERAFYSAATAMSQELAALMEPTVQLLTSKFSSDALVAIELCVVARSFRTIVHCCGHFSSASHLLLVLTEVQGSLKALDRMLPLVFCKHEEVMSAARAVFSAEL